MYSNGVKKIGLCFLVLCLEETKCVILVKVVIKCLRLYYSTVIKNISHTYEITVVVYLFVKET